MEACARASLRDCLRFDQVPVELAQGPFPISFSLFYREVLSPEASWNHRGLTARPIMNGGILTAWEDHPTIRSGEISGNQDGNDDL